MRFFSSFIEKYPAGQESIIGRSMAQEWKPFDDSFRAVELVPRASDDGKKNYQFDISGALGPFFVFSEQAAIDPVKLVKLIQTEPNRYRLTADTLKVTRTERDPELDTLAARTNLINRLIQELVSA